MNSLYYTTRGSESMLKGIADSWGEDVEHPQADHLARAAALAEAGQIGETQQAEAGSCTWRKMTSCSSR